jgi:hypothetical protein
VHLNALTVHCAVLQELAEKNARVLERELEAAVGMIVQLQSSASKVCV